MQLHYYQYNLNNSSRGYTINHSEIIEFHKETLKNFERLYDFYITIL